MGSVAAGTFGFGSAVAGAALMVVGVREMVHAQVMAL